MFRALEHEGVAATCFYDVLAAGRRLSSDQRISAITACAVLAKTLKTLRDPNRIQLVRMG